MKLTSKSAGRFSPAFLFKQDDLHPAVKIGFFILLLIFIPHLKFQGLCGLAFVLLLALIHFRVRNFISMILRMRWLFFSMLFIYAYTTPGQYLGNLPIELAPSYEGLRDGLYQMTRISLALAGISILMATSTKESLMGGIYILIKPLSFLNVSPERFTARLYLTLQNVDKIKSKDINHDNKLSLQDRFQLYLSNTQTLFLPEKVYLVIPRFGFLDWLCTVLIFMLLVWCL